MGQKVNPEIFKLSRTEGWKSKYLEGKKTNLGLHIKKDLEIKTFIKCIFTKVGLNVHYCKVCYLDNRLIIQTSFAKSAKLLDGLVLYRKGRDITTKALNGIKILRTKIKVLIFITFIYEASLLMKKYKKQILSVEEGLMEKLFNSPVITKTLFTKMLTVLTKHLLNDCIKKVSPCNNITNKYCTYDFIKLFFKSLSLFYKTPLKAVLILKNLRKSPRKKAKGTLPSLQKKIWLLRRYKRHTFFKKGINLMFLMTSQKESADAIASYVANTLKNFKKHKFFLAFVEKSLHLFAKNQAIQAVKIQLKGRINGADRARSYTLKAGNKLSLLTTSSRINYSEKTTFTPDGTLSVKVWIKYVKTLKQLNSKHLT
jgi:hypothetical protein